MIRQHCCQRYRPKYGRPLHHYGNFTAMKTTLVLNDELYRQAKFIASGRGCTVSSIVEEALRLLLSTANGVQGPSNPMLALMRATGRLFPRANRAPWIEPVAERALRARIGSHPDLAAWQPARTERVSSGFYTSQAMELVRR